MNMNDENRAMSNPLKLGVISENSVGIGTVTVEMVQERAHELALINGRLAQNSNLSDWDQAKRELTGESDMDPQESTLEEAPESERWDPLPGSTGHRVAVAPNDDEDEEGVIDSARLVQEGVHEAEHDQMLQAAIDASTNEGSPL